jgi:hypothetical protein
MRNFAYYFVALVIACSCSHQKKFASIQEAEESFTQRGYKIICSDSDNFAFMNADSIFVYHHPTQAIDLIPDDSYSKTFGYNIDLSNPDSLTAFVANFSMETIRPQEVRTILLDNNTIVSNNGAFLFTQTITDDISGDVDRTFLLNITMPDSICGARLLLLAASNEVTYDSDLNDIVIPAAENRTLLPSTYRDKIVPSMNNSSYIEMFEEGRAIYCQLVIDLMGNVKEIIPETFTIGNADDVTYSLEPGQNLTSAIINALETE